MAWDRIDDDTYSGDLPMDAFGTALSRAAELFSATNRRLPLAAELADALREAIRDNPDVTNREDADRLLARWCNLPRIVPKSKRPRAKAGDILQIPYGGDGTKQIFARVLFAPTKQRPGPGYGNCLVVHDLDAPAPLDAIRATPFLFPPFHVGDEEIAEGRWRIVGHVEPDDAELPLFECQLPNGQGGWRNALEDYDRTEVEDTPANRARVIENSIGPGANVVVAIRMMRKLIRWMPSYARSFGIARPA